MWTRQLLKENGKIAFRRNYWTCVLVCLISAFLGGGIASSGMQYNVSEEDATYTAESFAEFVNSIPPIAWLILAAVLMVSFVIGICVSILVSNVILVGSSRYFLENREHKTGVSQLFYGFQNGRYSRTVWVMFLRSLYVFGWSLLFLIPGIIKSYSYMMVPYIMAENTYLDKERVFQLSSKMMEGHKMEAFVLECSFIGWFLLAAFSGGILNILYVNPYLHATFAEFYSAVKAEAQMKGIIQEGELPGVSLPEV